MPSSVIEHQQHFLAGDVVAPRVAAAPVPAGSPGAIPAASSSWPAPGRIHRPLSRCVRMQWQEDLPVRELPGELMRRMHPKVVLPIPAIPPIAWTPTTPPRDAASASVAVNRASSAVLPVNAEMSRGSVRVAAAEPPSGPGVPAGSLPADAIRSRPRAVASNWARCGPAKPSASASSRAVSLRAVALTPRSRSLTDRGERVAPSASSSCVSPASVRSCRSSFPKPPATLSTTGASSPPRPPATAAAPTSPARRGYADPSNSATRPNHVGLPWVGLCGRKPLHQQTL